MAPAPMGAAYDTSSVATDSSYTSMPPRPESSGASTEYGRAGNMPYQLLPCNSATVQPPPGGAGGYDSFRSRGDVGAAIRASETESATYAQFRPTADAVTYGGLAD